jgi:hypothetical protein
MRFLIFFLLLNSTVLAGKPEWIPDYFVSYTKDTLTKVKGVRVKFVCSFDSDYQPHRTLRYGINGSDKTIDLNAENTYQFISTAGKYVFQFYYDSNFQEITTDTLKVKTGQITIISIHFKDQNELRPLKKPVIYLYPETDTDVSIELKPAGKLTFSYPYYSQSWKGTAHPDGSIDISGKQYPYLFWESEQRFNKFDKNIGCILFHQEDLIASLEKHLTQLGFNDQEKTDFITFWGPQLAKHKLVLAQFLLNDACNVFANLNVQPDPAHLNRVYLIWTEFDLNSSLIPLIKSQHLEPLNREGFDILEWGGIEIIGFPNFH